MITNKWVLLVLSVVALVVSYLATVDWQTMLPSKAGAIVMAIAIIKTVLAAIMPPVSQPTLTPLPKAQSFFGAFTHT